MNDIIELQLMFATKYKRVDVGNERLRAERCYARESINLLEPLYRPNLLSRVTDLAEFFPPSLPC